jgi:hypothetical protein
MIVAALPTVLDLQPDEAGDAFPVEVCVDRETEDNSGLIPAMAELLIDLYRKRLAREQAQHHDEPQGKEAVP